MIDSSTLSALERIVSLTKQLEEHSMESANRKKKTRKKTKNPIFMIESLK